MEMSQVSRVARTVNCYSYSVLPSGRSMLQPSVPKRLIQSCSSLRQEQQVLNDTKQLDQYRNYYRELKDTINDVSEGMASKSPSLVTLHRRLLLPKEFTLSVLARCLTCRSSQLPKDASDSRSGVAFSSTVPTSNLFDNHGLNIFGKNLLTYHVTQRLMARYPRLPTVVLNAAVDAYISQDVLANIARSWGIEAEKTSVVDRFLRNEPIQITLGKLRFFNNSLNEHDGVQLITSQNFSENSAYALATRSIIGALWASTQGTKPDLCDKFIDDHILSRQLDITRLFRFEQPTRELATLCRREGLDRPISKLLAESGRFSKAPVFIVGVFSGSEKLGEGFGSSLKEAKARAATDALMKWYCYEPTENQAPVIDHGVVIV